MTGIARGRVKIIQDIENSVGGAAAHTAPAGHFIQFHTADPGAAGTTAVAQYTTRLSVTWGGCSATTGEAANTNLLTLSSVPATETVLFWSEWTASSGGTFLADGQVNFGQLSAGSSPTVPVGSLTKKITVA